MPDYKVLIVKRRGFGIVSLLKKIIKEKFKNVSEVVLAENIEECRLLFDEFFLKLVIVDSSIAGPKFVQQVRNIRGDFIKIICLSGDGGMEKIMIEAGCDAFLAIPVDIDDIIKTIKPFLE